MVNQLNPRCFSFFFTNNSLLERNPMQNNIRFYEFSYPIEKTKILNLNHKKELLKNNLLSPKDRIVRKPLLPWIRELRIAMHDLFDQPRTMFCAETLADIYSQATWILLSMDNRKYAREICYSQIQMFITWSHSSQNNRLLKYVFQPWITLSRIDRLEKNFCDAMNKLEVLRYSDGKTNHVMNTYSTLEQIKIYLHAKRYTELIKFIECEEMNAIHYHNLFLQEALIIAYANTEKVHEALQVISYAKSYAPHARHIFNLRECEIYVSLERKNNAVKQIYSLYHLALKLIKNAQCHVKDIVFGLHTAHVMKMAAMNDEAIKLAYFCLEASEKMNDALLKSESLVMLYDLISEPEGKKLVENLMIEHYFQTQYVVAREQMLASFHDLKHVESKQNQEEMTSLFEDLLTFSL